MWSIEEITRRFQNLDFANIAPNSLALKLFDEKSRIGIGVGGDATAVLVIPGQATVPNFKTKFAKFDAWTSGHWLEQDSDLTDIAILRCKIDFAVGDQVLALGALFKGLVDLEERFQNAGEAILSMKQLFENGFTNNLDGAKLKGLIGEMLILLSSENPGDLVEYWHSDIDSIFDYSSNSERLEIKTTAGANRVHNFSGNQVPGPDGASVTIGSVLLSEVEVGSNLGTVFELLSTKLNQLQVTKVLANVVKTLGIHPLHPTGFDFDLATALGSIAYFKASEIPRPSCPEGVLSVKWEADLGGATKLGDFNFSGVQLL